MKTSRILVVAEKNYQKSVWCSKILEGIEKKNFNLISLEDLSNLNENDVVAIIGSTNHFLRKSILMCNEKKLRCVVVGAEISDFEYPISSIKVSRKSAVTSLVHYFNHLKRVNCALLGVNSFSNIDMEKKDAFLSSYRALYNKDAINNVFFSDDGVKECVNKLLNNVSSFDSVICSNDYFAVCFITEAKKLGIKIPDDILVAGYGDSYIGEKITPSLTTVAPKYFEMGTQTRKVYHYLLENPSVKSIEVLVDYDIIVRESTDKKEFKLDYHTDMSNFEPCHISIFDDENLKKIMGMDFILESYDKTLSMILDGIYNDIPYGALAEKLYLSDSALRYKLNKIFTYTNTKSKSELKKLIETLNLKDDENAKND
ncbi:MAG: LacI family transcriptional regulator [Ruminococcaceae bacterium]|nr:LacI family transcriptional regulator [Oscillospiraceae bacterium]